MSGSSWLAGARRVPSPNHDRRPRGAEISLLVIHSISLPRGEYGGDAIERLFTNRLPEMSDLRVSAHFLIRRDGELVQFVPLEARAWHAGASRWRGRERCNDISIGIELEGTDDSAFAGAQYRQLAALVRALTGKTYIRDVAAHSDIAPGRKIDPGSGFDWRRFLSGLAA
jgi:AmpD protein